MWWSDFLRRKKHVACRGSSKRVDRVVRWDDSAGYECSRDAKARFYAKNYSGRRCRGIPLPPAPLGPDLYVDDVVWRTPDDDDWELRRLVVEAQERAAELAAARSDCVVYYSWEIPLEEVKATGWDDDDVVDCSSRRNPNLTGMVVGGGNVDGSNGKEKF
ncbi:unnamed protein product [Linum tenue]|uniref:Uncharacterized protein n=1 Tax=Linum tenue TaxID=586396 RepID=A0AAV0JTA8_9ROSI|nr:unnamed protein product [Linum tenue]